VARIVRNRCNTARCFAATVHSEQSVLSRTVHIVLASFGPVRGQLRHRARGLLESLLVSASGGHDVKSLRAVKVSLLAFLLAIAVGNGRNPALDDAAAYTRGQMTSACYCITQDCNGCGLCIDAYPDCFCRNSSQTKAVFCIPNDCGDPVSLTKLCDADSRVEEAATGCILEAIQPCD
jgi:hypothetical protein